MSNEVNKTKTFVYVPGYPVGIFVGKVKGNQVKVQFEQLNNLIKIFPIAKCTGYATIEELKLNHPTDFIPTVSVKRIKEEEAKGKVVVLVGYHPLDVSKIVKVVLVDQVQLDETQTSICNLICTCLLPLDTIVSVVVTHNI